MKSRTAVWIFVALHFGLEEAYGHVYNGAKVVTYGEPCVQKRELPIQIELPKPSVEQPRASEIIAINDSLRGKAYGYNIQVPPPTVKVQAASRSYDFALDVPPPVFKPDEQRSVEKPIRYLTGLTSRIDRILVPACEYPSSRC